METLTLNQLTQLLKAKGDSLLPKGSLLLRKLGAAAILATSDIMLVAVSIAFSLLVREFAFPGAVNFDQYLSVILIVLPMFPVAYFLRSEERRVG